MPRRKVPVTATTKRTVAQVRRIAKGKGLSVNKLADFAGISRGYLSRLLRAEQSPTLDTLEKLADALDVEVKELVV